MPFQMGRYERLYNEKQLEVSSLFPLSLSGALRERPFSFLKSIAEGIAG
jgi:hypothetical protein